MKIEQIQRQNVLKLVVILKDNRRKYFIKLREIS